METPAEATKKEKVTLVIFLVLALFVIATRWVSSVRTPHSWDAVQYILGVQEYDVINHQPHPPGAFLLILLMRAMGVFTNSTHLALVYLNMVMSVLTIAFTLILVKKMYGNNIAVMSASIVATSQVFAFYGSTSNAYISEGLAGVVIAFLSWLSLSKKTWYYAMLSVMALAGAGAFRLFIVLTLFPLWLFSNLHLRRRKFLLFIVILVFSATIAAWFIPTVLSTGSYNEYSQSSANLYGAIMKQHSFFGQYPLDSLRHNTSQLFIYLFFCFNVFVFTFFLLPFCFFNSVAQTTDATEGFDLWWRRLDVRTKFLMIWIGPPLCFYVLFHIPKPGYLMTVLPAMATVMVILYEVFSGCLASYFKLEKQRVLEFMVLMTVSVNTLCFLGLPQGIDEIFYGDNLYQFTRKAIYSRYHSFQLLREHIVNKFSKDESAIFLYKRGGRQRLFRELSLLLPEYPVFEVNSMGDCVGFRHRKAIFSNFGTYEGRLLRELNKDFKEFMDGSKRKGAKLIIGESIGLCTMRTDFPADVRTLPLSGIKNIIVITPSRRTGKIAIVGAERVDSEFVGPFRLKIALRYRCQKKT